MAIIYDRWPGFISTEKSQIRRSTNAIGRPLYACDLNRSMQHLHSSTGEGGVENEAAT